MNDIMIDEVEKEMKTKNIVTIFMLTYKRPHFLFEAISAVLKQTYRSFSLIVLDNLSKDNTEQIVRSFNDERVLYLEHEGPNYLYAFSLSKTKYTIVLHDDDVVDCNYLEKMISIMEENEEIVAASPTANYINEDGTIFKNGKDDSALNKYVNHEYLANCYIKKSGSGMVFPAVIYRTSFFSDISSFLNKQAGPAGDQYLFFEICRRQGRIAVYDVPLINYRIHSQQHSQIKAAQLDFQLINCLYAIEYYKKVLLEYKRFLWWPIKTSLYASLKHYEENRQKEDIKTNYRNIPIVCKKSFKGKVYSFLFFMASLFPRAVLFNYRFIKRIVRHG